MALSFNEQQKQTLQNFSIETVRNLLQIDNRDIAKLCAQISMMPKKDKNGRMYFSREDIDLLRKTKNSQKTIKQAPKEITVPTKAEKPEVQKPLAPAPTNDFNKIAVKKICNSLSSMENNLTDKITNIIDERLSKILDDKLDGMDEVVVELVRCKTENETLRYKMNELNKEVYNLKNELSKYKELAFGVYIKSSGETIL